MNFSKIRPILQEYKNSPFFYCFIFLSILEAFSWYNPICEIREAFWEKQIWISVLIPILVITIFSKIPVNALLESHNQVKNRTPLLHRIFMAATFSGLLVADVIFFYAGLFVIFGTQHPELITRKIEFERGHIEGIIMEGIIPFLNFFIFIPTRKAINKQLSLGNYYDKGKEFAFAFPFIWMSLILSLIAVVLNKFDP